jgi:hypothetical protein
METISKEIETAWKRKSLQRISRDIGFRKYIFPGNII